MTRAQTVADRIVSEADASGFRAHGLHVLAGDGRRTPVDRDLREDLHPAAKGFCVIAAGIAADVGLKRRDVP